MSSEKRDRVHALLATLIPALTTAHQYTAAHPRAVSAITETHAHLQEAMGADPALSLMIVDDKVIFENEPLDDSMHVSRLVRLLRRRGIQHLRIVKGVTTEELTELLLLLSRKNQSLQEAALRHIQLGSLDVAFKAADTPPPSTSDDGHRQLSTISEQELALILDVYQAVRENNALPHDHVATIVSDIITTIKQEAGLLINFSALRLLDEYTFTHSTNVCILTLAQAMALGITDELLHDIGVAALLHDCGKIFVPEEVLNKQGKLTDDEWTAIQAHPIKGAEYLLDKPGIPPLAVVVAYEHHLQYNLSGYPKVPPAWKQNICSQMTTISDIFDALRTKRIYRDSLEMEVIAQKMVEMTGSALHPVLAKNFFSLLNTMLEEETVSSEQYTPSIPPPSLPQKR